MKYLGKRFVVFGRRMGEEYYIEHSSIKKARVEAWLHLNDGYDANILDQKTDKVVEIKIKK
jgi:predicted esterase YcpF (UPF0227 family)